MDADTQTQPFPGELIGEESPSLGGESQMNAIESANEAAFGYEYMSEDEEDQQPVGVDPVVHALEDSPGFDSMAVEVGSVGTPLLSESSPDMYSLHGDEDFPDGTPSPQGRALTLTLM